MMKRAAILAAMTLATVAAPAVAGTVTVGNYDSGNCYPVSCFAGETYGGGGSLYQQVYTASAFTSPTTIGSVSFFKSSGGVMDSATYDIAFYLSPNAAGSLSTNAASNRGALLSNFGSFSVSGAMPDTLTFDGSRFTYDPSLGNLLMQVSVTGLTNSVSYSSFFQADGSRLQTERLYQYANGETYTGGNALVTSFGAGAVPEPATWAMMIGGFGMVGGAMRRRKTVGLRFA